MGNKNKKKFKKSVMGNELQVENLVVNAKEHKILSKHREWLQSHFDVKISLPRTKSLYTDIIFASIEGVPSSINYVKSFLRTKVHELAEFESSKEDNVELITVSDSDSESETESKEIHIVNPEPEDTATPHKGKSDSKDLSDISVPSSSHNSYSKFATKENRRKRKRFYDHVEKSTFLSEGCSNEVTSTTNSDVVVKKARLSESVIIVEEPGNPLSQSVIIDDEPGNRLSQSVIIDEEHGSPLSQSVIIDEEHGTRKPAEEFIPLTLGTESANKKIENVNKRSWFKSTNSSILDIDDDIKIIDEPKSTVVPRRLRPIVIDGSNVAMEHGRTTHCFSIRGLKIAIDYFLNRGHTKVTAFIPKFRKNRNPNRKVPTTDVDLLEDLEVLQRVVYTPSRHIDGKCIASYDDRFIVKFATSNGGVIVSNDNYRDLLEDSEEFKQTIQQRLLQFCFIEDTFMVPDDPLGRNGPKLDDFLSFPPEEQ